MRLTACGLCQDSLKGIGDLLTSPRGEAPRPDEENSYWDVEKDLGLQGPLSAGMLECYPRELKLVRMERHLHTREYLVALEGEAVICLAPPQEIGSAMLKGLVALRIRAGQAIILDIGAWHWIPFPTDARTSRFQVIFSSGTGKTDLIFGDLPEPVYLQVEQL